MALAFLRRVPLFWRVKCDVWLGVQCMARVRCTVSRLPVPRLLYALADVVMLGAASTEPGAFFSKARLSHVAIRPNAAVPQPRLSNPSGVLAGGAACDGPAYAAPAQLDTAEDGPTVGGGAASVAGEADALSLAPGAPPAAAEGSHSPVLFPAPTTAAPSMAGSSLREGYGSSVARSGESACVYMPHDPRPVLVGGTHDGSTPPQRPSLTGSPQQNQELEFGSVEDALVSILRLHDPATLHKWVLSALVASCPNLSHVLRHVTVASHALPTSTPGPMC